MLVFCCMNYGYWELGLRFEWLALIIFEFSDSKVLTCSWNSWQVLCIVDVAGRKPTHTVFSHFCVNL